MILCRKRLALLALVNCVIFLTACSSAITPVEQIHQANKEPQPTVNKQIEMENVQKITQYRCQNEKKVEIEQQKTVKKSAKKETITVTFQGATYPLSSVVTKDGKKYTNIRWTWHEMRNGKAFLYDNMKKTLAANCVKQP